MSTLWIVGLAVLPLLLALVVAFAAALVYTTVTFGIWRLDRREADPDRPAEGLTEIVQFHGIAVDELIAATFLFLIHPLGKIPPGPVAKRELLARRPILLVHGYAQARSNFVLLAPRLMSAGLGPVYTVNLEPMSKGLRHHATTVSRRIDEIMAATGAADIDVVGHSMGGLVARLANAERPRIRRLVTLGTPHLGTRVAELTIDAAGADMRPAAPMLRALPEPPPGMIVAISSEHDNIVVPPHHAKIGDPGRNVVVEGVGHLRLLLDGKVATEVEKALAEDVITRERMLQPLTAKAPNAVRI